MNFFVYFAIISKNRNKKEICIYSPGFIFDVVCIIYSNSLMNLCCCVYSTFLQHFLLVYNKKKQKTKIMYLLSLRCYQYKYEIHICILFCIFNYFSDVFSLVRVSSQVFSAFPCSLTYIFGY
jgi:hypothetical protein